MDPTEFARERLSISPDLVDDTGVISAVAWNRVCGPDYEARGEMFAFDVNPERTFAGIVAVDSGPVVEAIDHRPGTAWLVERCVELFEKYGVPFAVDRTGPGGVFIDELTRLGVKILEIDATNLARASQNFYDLVERDAIRVRTNRVLDLAVRNAAKRPVGEAWAWGRKSSKVDISLLVAASVGIWALLGKTDTMPIFSFG